MPRNDCALAALHTNSSTNMHRTVPSHFRCCNHFNPRHVTKSARCSFFFEFKHREIIGIQQVLSCFFHRNCAAPMTAKTNNLPKYICDDHFTVHCNVTRLSIESGDQKQAISILQVLSCMFSIQRVKLR